MEGAGGASELLGSVRWGWRQWLACHMWARVQDGTAAAGRGGRSPFLCVRRSPGRGGGGFFVEPTSRVALTFCAVQFKSTAVLSSASKQHLLVAWLAGALMAWLAESYRRCTFAGQHAAKLAHSKELAEKMRHLRAQEELATAREEVRSALPRCTHMHGSHACCQHTSAWLRRGQPVRACGAR